MEEISNVNQETIEQESANKIYNYATYLLVNKKYTADEVKTELLTKGLNISEAAIVVENLEQQIRKVKRDRAKKDMLYGALWCVGGIIATVANIGFIFWGAILFGGIQFFRGAFNA